MKARIIMGGRFLCVVSDKNDIIHKVPINEVCREKIVGFLRKNNLVPCLVSLINFPWLRKEVNYEQIT